MGQVKTKIKVENSFDLTLSKKGDVQKEKVRSVERNALVDTGATLVGLPKRIIQQLGLTLLGTKKVSTATGIVKHNIFMDAQITVMDRICGADIMEIPDHLPPLLGYLVLQELDLIVDPSHEELKPNPEHGGEEILYLL